jgi:hypothetical protein
MKLNSPPQTPQQDPASGNVGGRDLTPLPFPKLSDIEDNDMV